MKKLCLFFICCMLILSCDSYVKECTYEVYQKGEQLQTNYKHYGRISETCADFNEGGTVYILVEVKKVKYKDVLK